MATSGNVGSGGIASLDQLYDAAKSMGVTPGWVKRDRPILTSEPSRTFAPALWKYRDVKPALDAASRLVDVQLAERRNLIMANPACRTRVATTETLVCAYQTILPGEAARSHRHTSHALRVILDAKGAYSVVNGEKTAMETGDVVLTPGWFWHGHGHDGDQPAYWFDGLDVPLTQLLDGIFFEDHPDGFEAVKSVPVDSPFRFKRDTIERNLEKAKPHPELHHGARINLDAPDMPTMELSIERLSGGMQTRRQRTSANDAYCVVSGAGETVTDEGTLSWATGDTIAIPAWTRHQHRASEDSVLFRMSDAPLMRFARYYRTEVE